MDFDVDTGLFGLGELISICGTSVLIDEAVEDFDGDCIGGTPIGRAFVFVIGRILSGWDVGGDLIGGEGVFVTVGGRVDAV